MTHLVEPTRQGVLHYEPTTAAIERRAPAERRLRDVQAIFADRLACQALWTTNPLIYRVTQ
ncbi:MAG: hypothetical protein ACK47M_20055, partial [Caldilinea sp.]